MTNEETHWSNHPGDEGPVTVSVSRKVKPGSEAEYEQCVSDLVSAAADFKGHQGATILRPSSATNDEYVIIYRFDNYTNCQGWEQSEVRAQLLKNLEGLVEGEASTQQGTGLEFWFTLPELPAHKPPSPHKMAIVLIGIVYALVLGLNLLLKPLLGPLPSAITILIVVVLQVLLMTYVIMPRVTVLLKRWLFDD